VPSGQVHHLYKINALLTGMARLAYKSMQQAVNKAPLFGCGRVDIDQNFADGVGRETALIGVFAYHVLIGRYINAVDFISGNVTVDPLYLRPEIL
jgi:hypothetical protein